MCHTCRCDSPNVSGLLRWAERGVVVSVSDSEYRRGGRRRRANASTARKHSHKVKVTPEEEAFLLQLADRQNVTIPRLLVESAMNVEAGVTATERRQAIAELFAIRRLLAAMSNNVNQLAAHANATSELPKEAAATVKQVRESALHLTAAIDRLTT